MKAVSAAIDYIVLGISQAMLFAIVRSAVPALGWRAVAGGLIISVLVLAGWDSVRNGKFFR